MTYSAREHLRRNVGQGMEERIHQPWFEEICKDNSKILEIGFGKGNFLKKVESTGKNIELYGIDVSEENLKIAREQVGVKCGLLLMDIAKEKFPWKDNYFDAIVMMEVLEHVESPLTTTIEIQRVCKRNGTVLYSYPLESKICGAPLHNGVIKHNERKHESGFHSFPMPGMFTYENQRYFWNQQYFRVEDEERTEYHIMWKMTNLKLDRPHCLDVVNIDWNTEELFEGVWTEPKFKDIV